MLLEKICGGHEKTSILKQRHVLKVLKASKVSPYAKVLKKTFIHILAKRALCSLRASKNANFDGLLAGITSGASFFEY